MILLSITRGLKVLEKLSALLSNDFCPSANRWVYWLKNPFWVVVNAVVGSVLCGVFVNPWIFILTALLLAVVGLGTSLPWLAIRGISCQVMFDVRRIRYGEAALVRLRIQNRWPFPVWGLSLINGFATKSLSTNNALSEHDEGIAFARVPGWSTIEYTWPFVARRRGRYPLNGVAEVETSFPFGLFRARRKADVSGQLFVWPETVFLPGLPDAAESQLSEEIFSDRRVGEFGDILGTRLFRQGDSLRRVHWAQTARQQTLIVTERQAPMMSTVRVILDLSSESHSEESRRATVEQCIRVAASLCDSLHRQHCRVELLTKHELFVIESNMAGLQRAMDALAAIDVASERPSSHESRRQAVNGRGDFAITVTTESGFRPGRPHQIVVTLNSGNIGVDKLIPGAWIGIDGGVPISHLTTEWRKQVS